MLLKLSTRVFLSNDLKGFNLFHLLRNQSSLYTGRAQYTSSTARSPALRMKLNSTRTHAKGDAGEWIPLGVNERELTLDLTLPTGQSFRWRKTGDQQYTGVVGKQIVTVKQELSGVKMRVHTDGGVAASDMEIIQDYFNLSTSLEDMYEEFSRRDKRFRDLSPYFPGARMLRQAPLECMFSFICSSNNHISRIHGMVERLCSTYGDSLGTVTVGDPGEEQEYFAFPSLDQLALATDEDLRSQGFGYRAKFIVGSVELLLAKEGGGEAWLNNLRTVPYKEAVEELCTLPGIGPKVAACVCLFSLDKHCAIPVDTHVWQLACRHYTKSLQGKSLTPKLMEAVEGAIIQRFGDYAGWAHNILFIAELASHRDRIPSHLRPIDKSPSKVKSPLKSSPKGSPAKKDAKKVKIESPMHVSTKFELGRSKVVNSQAATTSLSPISADTDIGVANPILNHSTSSSHKLAAKANVSVDKHRTRLKSRGSNSARSAGAQVKNKRKHKFDANDGPEELREEASYSDKSDAFPSPGYKIPRKPRRWPTRPVKQE